MTPIDPTHCIRLGQAMARIGDALAAIGTRILEDSGLLDTLWLLSLKPKVRHNVLRKRARWLAGKGG